MAIYVVALLNQRLEQESISRIFFKKHITNADTHTHTSTHTYKHTYAHSTPINIFERLSRFDLKIHEVSH
jgi:hypothetical protein